MTDLEPTELISSSRPNPRLVNSGVLLLLGFGLLIGVSILIPDTDRGGKIWAALAGGIFTILGISMVLSAARRQAIARHSRRASDLCLLEHWTEALDPLRHLLAKPVPQAQIRYQGLLELAGAAEHTGRLEGACQIYQAIAAEQPQGLLGSLASVGKAIVLLKLDQLADAEDIIRRLEVSSEDKGLKSLVLLARLYQQIKTGHYQEALEEESGKRELARVGMSSKAAYVYALLGLACERRRLVGPQDEHQTDYGARAKTLWHQATMLLEADSIVEKFPELAELRTTYGSAEPLPGPTEVPTL